MPRQQLRQTTFATLLTLFLATIANAEPADKYEIEQALASIGSGSAEELKDQLFTYRITIFDSQYRAQAINALPASLRDHRIIEGNRHRPNEALIEQSLEFLEPATSNCSSSVTMPQWRNCGAAAY